MGGDAQECRVVEIEESLVTCPEQLEGAPAPMGVHDRRPEFVPHADRTPQLPPALAPGEIAARGRTQHADVPAPASESAAAHGHADELPEDQRLMPS